MSTKTVLCILLKRLKQMSKQLPLKLSLLMFVMTRLQGGFEEYTPQISPVIDRQQIAMDAIMAGMADMEARQTQAIDALMTGMMELYAQNEEVKAEIAANSKQQHNKRLSKWRGVFIL